MNKIATALNYIDEDLIFAALETVSVCRKTKISGNEKKHTKRKPDYSLQGGVKVKAVALSLSVLGLCAIFAVWAIIVLAGNHEIDIYRLNKEEKIIGSFAELQEYYPGKQTAERLSVLDLKEMEIALYYDIDTDWQNSENWYSLIFSGYGESVSFDGVLERCTVYCLFTGSLEDWKVNSVYDGNTQYMTIGETEVQLSYSEMTECSYAIFVKDDIVYDVRVQFGNSTTTDLMTILEWLLN